MYELKKSRNITAHDYDSVNYKIIENTIRFNLPKLKEIFIAILHEFESQTPKEKLHSEIAESKLKKEQIILRLYLQLKNEDIEIDNADLEAIKEIQELNKAQ